MGTFILAQQNNACTTSKDKNTTLKVNAKLEPLFPVFLSQIHEFCFFCNL